MKIILSWNVIFDEKTLGIKLLSFDMIHGDSFDIIEETRSIMPSLGLLTTHLIIICFSACSQFMLTESV